MYKNWLNVYSPNGYLLLFITKVTLLNKDNSPDYTMLTT